MWRTTPIRSRNFTTRHHMREFMVTPYRRVHGYKLAVFRDVQYTSELNLSTSLSAVWN